MHDFEVEVLVDWRYGVDIRIVDAIDAMRVDDCRVLVISETEVIIKNP